MTKADRAYSTRAPDAGRTNNPTVNLEPQSGPSVGVPVSRATRRAAIGALAGGAFLAAGGAVQAQSPDEALLRLGKLFDAACERTAAALAAVDRAEDAYLAAKPVMPDVLRHRLLDHWELQMPVTRETRAITDGDDSAFYNADEVAQLRESPRMRRYCWLVDNATGERKACSIDSEIDRARFSLEIEDVPFPAEQARADEVLAAWDAHEKACGALSQRVGLDAAADAYNAAAAEKLKIMRQMADKPAVTLEGLRVRARAVADIHNGDVSGDDYGQSLDRKLMWATIRDLVTMPREVAYV
ncbi:MAG: hypothetical protein R3D69_12070 [Xanthobacteraceae bacterium]